ncbi:MAG: methyltransferase domain-containing protein [Eubacteriales bacterium]
MFEWNANQYLKFKNQRTQPAIDLVSRISVEHPKKVIDLGCGPGNSTGVLAERFKDASILGVDNSADMIATAKENYPHLDFSICDIGGDLSALGKDFNIVFSNACIQWVPDHRHLIKNLLGLVGNGGVLAIQIPFNFNEPIHRIIDEVAAGNVYLPEKRPYHVLTTGEYFDIFSEISNNFDIWEVAYNHVLDSHRDILEWYRGTGMRPYLSALPKDEQPLFEQAVLSRIVRSYPVQKNGKVIFRFPRLFMTASPK